ncbi:MAG: response regulator [Treponema sp.]|jgi:signal transduction histidine kinase/DNA-binding response OmpR family regulator/ferredoxin|nr:response regulator [Treponema sp.]
MGKRRMKSPVKTREELCVGCNRCIRVCPVEAANVAYMDRDERPRVRVDADQCIACGACVGTCRHGARCYEDDLAAFLAGVEAGEKITLIAAPSLKTNFRHWKRLLGFFRALGVGKIYDVSLGADISAWAHRQYVKKHNPPSLITTLCPALVSWCELHRPRLLPRLSPVQSPLGALAVYLREYEGISGKIAALSPCIAKGHEFGDGNGKIEFNLTFNKIHQYLSGIEAELPAAESDFDSLENHFVRAFEGGNDPCRVDHGRGRRVFKELDLYETTSDDALPPVFDVLSCAGFCDLGPGSSAEKNSFLLQAARALLHGGREENGAAEKRYAEYTKRFDLAKFLWVYRSDPLPQHEFTEQELDDAFKQLGKDSYEEKNFDCGGCGSDSCLEMARKIALGINLPFNCLTKARGDLFNEQRLNIDLYRKNAQYIELVHQIGSTLLSVNAEDFSEVMINAMEAICTTLGGCGAHLWKAEQKEDRQILRRIYGYPIHEETGTEWFDDTMLPGWISSLSAGFNVGRNYSIMNEAEKTLFRRGGIYSVLAVPITIKSAFWGFISVNRTSEQNFTEEDIAAITAGGLLVVSSILERELTQTLINAREDALAGTRAKSDFLSRMSHEIRTPMNAIIGMTRIAENTDDVSKLRYCLSTINASSTHLLGIINDILDMSKIESGRFDLDSIPFNLEKTLIKVCNIINEKTLQKDQSLAVALKPGTYIYYQGDELRLSQVITNLLSNAVKFTPESGKIHVYVEEVECAEKSAGKNPEENPEGAVSAEAPRNVPPRSEGVSRLRFSVTDTGIGMSGEQMEKLFLPFQQADKNITQRFGGTGLGLAISKSIVEKMNGRIWVESSPGTGSSFFFEVELSRSGSPDTAALAKASYPRGLKILVVENDDELREHLVRIIGVFGMKAETAVDMSGAVALVEEAENEGKPYDVIFVEYDLGSGPREERRRRTDDKLGLLAAGELGHITDSDRILIICTFLEWSRIEARAEKAGIKRFVAKPVFSSTLLDGINRVVGKSVAGVERSAGERPDFTGVSVLLVEDIEINREIFIAILEDTHVAIDTAENGTEAVKKFLANPKKYDLIIMDVQMPEMNGLEATKTIRAVDSDEAKSIPIVAMTANAFKEDIESCLAAGMNDHLKKPIDETALLEKISFYTLERRQDAPE